MKEETTLEQVLDEDGLKLQFNSPSLALKEFFNHTRLRQVVRYTTSMPTNPVDRQTSYRYPFVCQEILRSGSTLVLDYFFPPRDIVGEQGFEERGFHFDQEALDGLFLPFLEGKFATDSVLGGYLCGIVTSLNNHRREPLERYFFGNTALTELMIKTIGGTSPLGIFLCPTVEDSYDLYEDKEETASEGVDKHKPFFKEKVTMYSKVVEELKSNPDLETKIGCLHLLRQLAREAFNVPDGEDLVGEVLFQQELWEILIDTNLQMISRPSGDMRFLIKTSAELFQDILTLLDQSRIGTTPNDPLAGLSVLSGPKIYRAKAFSGKLNKKYLANDHWIGQWFGNLFQKIQSLLECILKGDCTLPKRVNSGGGEAEWIETHRLALLELIPRVLTLESQSAKTGFLKSNLLPSLMALCLRAPWCTFYHHQLYRTLSLLLDASAESAEYTLLSTDGLLVSFLLKALEKREDLPHAGYRGVMESVGKRLLSLDQDKREVLLQGGQRLATVLAPVIEIEDDNRDDVFKRAHTNRDIGQFTLEDINIMPSKTFKRPTRLPRPPPPEKIETAQEEEEEDRKQADEKDEDNEREASNIDADRVTIEYDDDDDENKKDKAKDKGKILLADPLITIERISNDLDVENDQTEENQGRSNPSEPGISSLQPHENESEMTQDKDAGNSIQPSTSEEKQSEKLNIKIFVDSKAEEQHNKKPSEAEIVTLKNELNSL